MRGHALAAMILLAGCAGTVKSPEARCSQLVPATWAAGIEGYPIPMFAAPVTKDEELLAWQKAFIGQSGQLEKANGRTVDSIGIVSGCEAMINGTRKRGIFG